VPINLLACAMDVIEIVTVNSAGIELLRRDKFRSEDNLLEYHRSPGPQDAATQAALTQP
jgi:hypothetical protein